MQRFLRQITPFFLLGFAIVAFAFGIMLLAYLFFFGALLGLTLYLIKQIRNKFFPSKKPTKSSQRQGRIIDSDDWKKL